MYRLTRTISVDERSLRMSSSNWIRWGALGALLAGTAWLASGIFSLVIGQGAAELHSDNAPYAELGPFSSYHYYLLEILWCIALAGMLAGLVGFHARQAPNYGRLGTAGFFAAFVGIFSILVSTVASLLTESGDVLDWLFVLGFVGTLVGFVLLGTATLRARVLPRWCGILFFVAVLGIPVYFGLGSYGGAILNSLVWLASGYSLWSERGASVEQYTPHGM
jgi:hypothetical protein